MRVMIVGCGAVGQVIGLHLQAAGVEIAYYARSDSAERLVDAQNSGGLTLYQIAHSHRHQPLVRNLKNYQVVTDVQGSQSFKPDQIWFTTPSQVYYSEWFRDFLDEVPATSVVCFAPEGWRPEFFPGSMDKERFVFGGITFIAWQGDLEGGDGHQEGVNFWLPPLLEMPVMGEASTCRDVVGLLRKGGLRAVVKKPGYQSTQASVTAVMTAFTAGLELADWSLKSYRKSHWVNIAAGAAREAVLGQLSSAGTIKKALVRIAASSTAFSLVSVVLPLMFPFELEEYLEFHYTKTRVQTLHLLELFESDGIEKGMPVGDIRALRDAMGESENGL